MLQFWGKSKLKRRRVSPESDVADRRRVEKKCYSERERERERERIKRKQRDIRCWRTLESKQRRAPPVLTQPNPTQLTMVKMISPLVRFIYLLWMNRDIICVLFTFQQHIFFFFKKTYLTILGLFVWRQTKYKIMKWTLKIYFYILL